MRQRSYAILSSNRFGATLPQETDVNPVQNQEEEDCDSMGDTLRSILTRFAAYVGVVVAAGLLFLAGMTVYQLMWPKPVVPFGQMGP